MNRNILIAVVCALSFLISVSFLYATVTGADEEKPLKKKEARPNTCCTLNVRTDENYPGVSLHQICFGNSSTSLLINHAPGQTICYHPGFLHFKEDNGRTHRAIRVQGAELCKEGKRSYKTQARAALVFPAVRRNMKHFSVWEEDGIPPAGFQNFHWSNVSLAKCYKAK